MAGETLLKEIRKEEQSVARDVEKMLGAALADKALLAKVDKATTACGASNKPPKEIVKLFETAQKTALKNLKSAYPSASVSSTLKYTQVKGNWRATPKITCGMALKQVGGMSYKVQPGDTLWGIAKSVYGAGGLWTEIAAANSKTVASSGNFILAGVPLKLPKLSVPVAACGIDMVSAKAAAPKPSLKPAKDVCVPPYTIDLNLLKPAEQFVKIPGGVIKITSKLTGELTGVCDLLLSSGVTLKAAAVAVEKEASGFIAGIQINSVGERELKIGAKIGGTSFGIKLNDAKPGRKTGFASSKVSFKSGRTVFTGTVGVDVSVEIIMKMQVQDLKGDLHKVWVEYGPTIIRTTLFAGVALTGVACAALILSPVPGDEVVCFGAAMRMAPAAMKTMRYVR